MPVLGRLWNMFRSSDSSGRQGSSTTAARRVLTGLRSTQSDLPRNPHFDDYRLIWSDEWSGLYSPPPAGYWNQFNEKWALWKENYTSEHMPEGIKNHFAGPTKEWLDYNSASFLAKSGGSFNLDRPFSRDFFRDKDLLDVACGLGRWTYVMLNLAPRKVVSIDISPVAVEVVRTVNPHAYQTDIFDLLGNRDYAANFDFTLAWGVLMNTHDPRLAFVNVASTVRKHGSMYVYVYGENGFHKSPHFNMVRKTFHSLKTFEERIAFAEQTNPACTLPGTNVRNLLGWYDALCPFFNWTIPLEVLVQWYRDADFRNITLLNRSEIEENRACGYHVLGQRNAGHLPVCDPELEEILEARAVAQRQSEIEETQQLRKLARIRGGAHLRLKSFVKEQGHCYIVQLPGGVEMTRLFLYENDKPLFPGDALHDSIRQDGKGSYSVWPDGDRCALLMSTSDNTDPNHNGRTYTLRWVN